MKFRKLIPLFLVLVLSIQFLPLQRIAAWLSSGQMTEEITHTLDAAKSKSFPCEMDPALLTSFFVTGSKALIMFLPDKFHSTESLCIRHADEILTPPPNE